MSKKPLIIVSADADLQKLEQSLNEGKRLFDESVEFLKKQAEAQWATLIGTHWDEIEQYLNSKGLLPDDYEFGVHGYNNNTNAKYGLGFCDGVLYLYDKNSGTKDSSFLKFLLDHLN